MRTFHRYFLTYLFNARTRQGLLFLALAGLFLSSTALIVIQGIMGGLQRGLVARSQSYNGYGVLQFEDNSQEASYWQEAQSRGWSMSRELQTEVLVRNGGQVAPLVLHGIDLKAKKPPFLENKDFTGIILGADLAGKLRTSFFADVNIIAPGSTEALAGEIPRQLVTGVSDYILTEVIELDALHAWIRLPFVQNLLRQRGADRWRFYNAHDWNEALAWSHGKEGIRPQSWEEKHQTLVWALNLETRVMLALFTAMALLVALAITTGLFLFFGKIRPDLASFWLLGLSLPKIERLVLSFVVQLSALTCAIGVGAGALFLVVLERFGHNLMPDIFVERNFPVEINLQNISISFFIPFLISLVFSLFSFFQFKRDNPNFIQLVRGAGESS